MRPHPRLAPRAPRAPHRNRIGQVQAALAGAHRQAQPLPGGDLREQVFGQPGAFVAEDQPVPGLPAHGGEIAATARAEGEAALRVGAAGLEPARPAGVTLHARDLVVVQTGAAQQINTRIVTHPHAGQRSRSTQIFQRAQIVLECVVMA